MLESKGMPPPSGTISQATTPVATTSGPARIQPKRRSSPEPGTPRSFRQRAVDHCRALWRDRQRRDSLLGMATSLGLHVILLAILGTIVLHQARSDFEYVTIDTVQQIEDRSPIEGPVEQISLFTGESGGTEEGDN